MGENEETTTHRSAPRSIAARLLFGIHVRRESHRIVLMQQQTSRAHSEPSTKGNFKKDGLESAPFSLPDYTFYE